MVVAVAALRWPVSLVVVVVVVVAAWWSVVVVVVVARRSVALVVITVAGRPVALVVVVSWLLVSLVLAWRALLFPIKKARQKSVKDFCEEEKDRKILHLVEGAPRVALHSFSSFASNSFPTRRDLSMS